LLYFKTYFAILKPISLKKDAKVGKLPKREAA